MIFFWQQGFLWQNRKAAMELSKHVIDFEKRNAIKSQVLVDFIADWTEPQPTPKAQS
jgi:uncharacterized DUF497 family protein